MSQRKKREGTVNRIRNAETMKEDDITGKEKRSGNGRRTESGTMRENTKIENIGTAERNKGKNVRKSIPELY